ncbi:putative tRNA (guanine(26)-N(2))-dimethyltransferase [Hypsibius exemplaris]|uniref:tRNA (guanine(26)-N(2))-dimethyltransferase n=1 Tax=Hypsibius exemplaris TaxID=2072580 RepID=A0A1W0WCK7_HYPEX|nr:putative tRNA (guanine(26)-N(2))-dimethyltransferase [Hypsibius exemplaris]
MIRPILEGSSDRERLVRRSSIDRCVKLIRPERGRFVRVEALRPDHGRNIDMDMETDPAPASPKKTSVAVAEVIKEGKAVLAAGISTDKVFYNPIQEFNRDLSCLILSVFFEKFKSRVDEKARIKASRPENAGKPVPKPFAGRILDAMAATGLRTCRYALEVPHVAEVVGNDYDPNACEAIKLNAAANGVTDRLTVTNQDARRLMLNAAFDQQWFHAVDLDPFGTAAPFLEGALQCVADGGLLMVTCTDTAILCGNFPEACYSRYASTCIRNPAHHELSLRILLNCIAMRAGQLEKNISAAAMCYAAAKDTYISTVPLLYNEDVWLATIWNCTVLPFLLPSAMCEPHKTAYDNAVIGHSNICGAASVGPTCGLGDPYGQEGSMTKSL